MKKCDVAIAGGGVIGGAIALELARAGLRVCVYDRQKPGQEASWASAGIISPAPENPGMIATVELRSEEHTSELQSHVNLVCRLLLEKKKDTRYERDACFEGGLAYDS